MNGESYGTIDCTSSVDDVGRQDDQGARATTPGHGIALMSGRSLDPCGPREAAELSRAISAEIEALYTAVYGHDRTTATTYINDNIVVCVLQNILSEQERTLVDGGSHSEVIDGRVAFQADTEDEFTAAVQRLTRRRVVAFLSANQAEPDIACELFFLDAPPLSATGPAGMRAEKEPPIGMS
jgi:uncharacterized protein YbcI